MLIRSEVPPPVIINSLKLRFTGKHPEMIAQFQIFQEQIRDGLVRERLMALLSGFFGLLAALLGMIGSYGLICIWWRAAATKSEFASHWQRSEAGLLIGIAIGAALSLSLAAARGAGLLLFRLKPYDPFRVIAAAGLLTAIGAVASFSPARRAFKLDPVAALRCD